MIWLALLIALGIFFGTWLGLDWHWLISIVLAVGGYVGTTLLTRPRERIGGIRIDTLKNGDDLKELMLEAKDDLIAIELAERRISNLTIRNGTRQLITTGRQILHYLQTNPEKISSARRFFTYYLSTARGILDNYLKVQDTGLHTQEVVAVTRTTERSLPILNQAFEKQFNHLMRNEYMEIEADVKLLELNLKMDD